MRDKIKNDPLAQIILSIIESMRKDFVKNFESIYSADEDLRHYKRRLYDKLRGFPPEDIADGYELFFDQSRGFCPTVPELVEFSKQAQKLRRQKECHKNDIEQREVQTDSVKINVDPLKLLVAAKEAAKAGDGSGYDRDGALKAHNALLTIHALKIFRPQFSDDKKCAVSFCHNLGVTSANTRGGGPFYCREHAKLDL